MTGVSYHQLDLESGPRLALATIPWAETASFGIWVPAGSRDDPAETAGLAHFVEHMAFKGTERRDARQLSIEIEGQGGQINAATSEDCTCYDARGEADLLPTLVDIVCDLVWNPVFPDGEIALEREVIREEIALYQESPSDHITDLIANALWGSHPLGRPIVGSSESIDRVTRPDLQSHVASHHRRHNVVVAAAGPFEPGRILELVSPHVPNGSSTDPSGPECFTPDLRQAGNHVTERRNGGQCHLALGYHTPGRHDETRHALRMLSLILGENFSSRLFQELREKRGLCYHVASDVALFDDTGALEITIALEPEKRGEVLDSIQIHLDDLAANGPTEEELERAKRYAIGQSRVSFESSAAHLAWAAETLLHYDRVVEPEDARENIRRVTTEQVANAAAVTFPTENQAIAEIVG